jgi:DedD protein
METDLDKALKRRLLGAVILAALLVILVPEWLDGAGHKSRFPQSIEMRDKPVFQPMREIMPEPSQPVRDNTSDAIPKLNTRKHSSIQAWALQVGSFKDKINAHSLKDRLMVKGFPAYVDTQKTPDKTSFRVRIGPELDRSRLEKLKQKVLKSEKLKGMIVNHP